MFVCLSGWSGCARRSVSADGGAVIAAAAADGGRSALVGAGGETTGTDPSTFTSYFSAQFPFFLSSFLPCPLILHRDVYV